MVTLILKAMPLAIMLFGTVQVLKQAPNFVDVTKKTTTQVELNEIAKYMKISSLDPTWVPPVPENFSDFLRTNMKAVNASSGRDVSLDLWGMAYRLVKVNDRAVLIVSNGADMFPDTSDDIRAMIFSD